MRCEKYVFLALLIFFCYDSNAQWLQRVEIDPSYGSSPTVYTIFKNKLLLSAYDGYHGRELWQADSNYNPILLSDLFPGGSNDGFFSVPRQKMAAIGDTLYFTGTNGITGLELYGYDGSGSAPFLVKDIIPGIVGAYPVGLTVLKDKLYFGAYEPSSGNELWCYDPAIHAARLIRDIEPGINSSTPTYFNVINDKIAFIAETGSSGIEMYTYDPDADSLEFFDIEPGYQGSYPMNFISVDNKLYFSASTSIVGSELYSYDGLTDPFCVKNICPGNWSTFEYVISRGMGYLNNVLFFSGTFGRYFDWPQLMKYNITTGNVTLDTLCNGSDAEVKGFITYHNKVYFGAKNQSGSQALWCSDGVNKPTKVAEIQLHMYYGNENMIVFKDWLYFTGSDGYKGDELYKYHDTKTSTGVQLVSFDADVNLYPNPSTDMVTLSLDLKDPQQLSIRIINVQGRTLFIDGLHTYGQGKNNKTIDVSSYTPGQYCYKIVSKEGKNCFSGKFQKL